ncbi:hypothetical protein [Neorhizobium galegae]|uniref:hypothetical protein n=1 Tax=Neorhizobium galegae TaxID=399 RepID=UPI000622906D|nr:hypothetical protein [Neorhizobium galegae]CDZ30646.1 Hypothetical protein NGAL_HAMBI490_55150 [Neorhizobium galegae bv. officinalis]KAA9386387.1 hypothetical protein F4V88_07830 [Neorhizobium galegae]KAB1112759.1 hypothetical protein F4V89_15135 [Neorhizobium galegae]MCM2501346.1 hypothetical protein [Neorhizobium galegae]MCQ1772158.1 hypothetical protein [Neorhizobium galegae]
MEQEKQRLAGRLLWLLEIVWTVLIMSMATAVGAYFGWQNHGLGGALALGFVGLVAGGFLSSPSLLLQVLN